MRTFFFFTAVSLTVCLMSIGFAGSQEESLNVAGEWDIAIEFFAETGHHTVIFTQEGDSLSGVYRGQFLEGDLTHAWREIRYVYSGKGTVKGNAIDFTGHLKNGPLSVNYHYTGIVQDDTMKGMVDMGEYGAVPFKAKRKKQ